MSKKYIWWMIVVLGAGLLIATLWGPIVSNVEQPKYVIQQDGKKIAMTAPVTQQGDGSTWKVRFIMPSSYTMKTLPKPNYSAVKLKEIAAKRYAVIRFSGAAGEDSLKRRTKELNEWLSTNNLTLVSEPIYAFYNPPWTLPFLRRNEVMVEIPASPAD
jgi:hypothetical protein